LWAKYFEGVGNVMNIIGKGYNGNNEPNY
jgi:hypothetical protein